MVGEQRPLYTEFHSLHPWSFPCYRLAISLFIAGLLCSWPCLRPLLSGGPVDFPVFTAVQRTELGKVSLNEALGPQVLRVGENLKPQQISMPK